MQSTAGGDAWTSRSKTPRAEQRLIEGPRSCAGVLLMPNWQASADRGEIRTRRRGWPEPSCGGQSTCRQQFEDDRGDERARPPGEKEGHEGHRVSIYRISESRE